MFFKIDSNSGVPVYLQIINQIKHAISIGFFEIGGSIPTIREMALQFRVNPNTVAKAVRELEREGFIKTFVGKGSFVTDQAKDSIKTENKDKAIDLTKKYVRDINWLGCEKNEVTKLVKKEWDLFEKEKKKND